MMQLSLTLERSHPQEWPCPCCGGRVSMDTEHPYDPSDQLCCWCRDIHDERLSRRVRERRAKWASVRLCCLRRQRLGVNDVHKYTCKVTPTRYDGEL